MQCHPSQITQLLECSRCGLIVKMNMIKTGELARCSNCQNQLLHINRRPYQTMLALTSACMIMLLLSISFPFMSFNTKTLFQEITLLTAVYKLIQFDNILLACLLLLSVIIFPALFISSLFYLYMQAILYRSAKQNKVVSKWHMKFIYMLINMVKYTKPWLMADVFLVGVLISLIKITSLAEIGIGASFIFFCIYNVLLIKCVAILDIRWLFNHFIDFKLFIKVNNYNLAHPTNKYLTCNNCGILNDNTYDNCQICNHKLAPISVSESLQRALAFLITAVIFYIPANFYPIMYTVNMGKTEGSSIMQGIMILWHIGSYPIAIVILVASIIIPLVKIILLSLIYYNAYKHNVYKQSSQPTLSAKQLLFHSKVYHITELIGRWSMIDIFVVAILVALVQLQNLMTIYPAPAALSFAIVVISTILSSMSFDKRLLYSKS